MDSEMTHTIGTEEAVRAESPFHIIKGVLKVVKMGKRRSKQQRNRPLWDCLAVRREDAGISIFRCK